jgi:tetratricopeptide (TPR) repeat protein
VIFLHPVCKKLQIGLVKIALCVPLAMNAALGWGASVCPPWPSVNEDGLGPFDYRDPKRADLLYNNVERNHFNSNVQTLRGGQTAAIGADLHFVLHRFPNHPKALETMMRLSERERRERPRGALHDVECYLYRATVFSPYDATAKTLYGIYLLKKKKSDEALVQLNEANALNSEDVNVHYNLGLLHLQQKNYEKAALHAKKAYALGLPLPGLRERLRQAGAWTD